MMYLLLSLIWTLTLTHSQIITYKWNHIHVHFSTCVILTVFELVENQTTKSWINAIWHRNQMEEWARLCVMTPLYRDKSMFCQNALLSLTRSLLTSVSSCAIWACPSVTHLQAKNHLCFQYWWKKLMSYRSLLLLHKSVIKASLFLYHTFELGKNNSAVSWPTANHCYHGRWYLVLNVLQWHRS